MAYVDKAGDTMTGALVVKAAVTAGDATQFYNVGLNLTESTAAPSKRASMNVGSGWNIGQDYLATGVKDLYIFNGATAKASLKIGTDDVVYLPNPPKITSAQVDQDGVCNVAYAGADDSGGSNAATAFQVCLDKIASRANGGTLLIPSGGMFRIDTQLNYGAAGAIAVKSPGGRSAKIVQNCPTLFNFASNAPSDDPSYTGGRDIAIENLMLYMSAANGKAFNFVNPEAVSMINIKGRPTYPGSGYWESFITGHNLRSSHFERFYVQNTNAINAKADVRGQFMTLTASQGSTDNHMKSLLVQGFNNAFYMVTNTAPCIEGTIMSDCTIVQCNRGITWVYNGPAGYSPPELHFRGGHMSCFECFVGASNVAQIHISDCDLELNSVYGDTSAGIILTNVDGAYVHDNNISFTGGSRATSAIVVAGGLRSRIFGNSGVTPGCTNYITLQSGARNASVYNNETYGAIGILSNGGVNTYHPDDTNRILT